MSFVTTPNDPLFANAWPGGQPQPWDGVRRDCGRRYPGEPHRPPNRLR